MKLKEKIKKNKPAAKEKKNLLPGAVAIGLVLAVIVYAVMLNAEKNLLENYAKETVCVAIKTIPEGQRLTEADYLTYFTLQEIDASLVPTAAIRTPEQLEGMIARYDIDECTLVTSGMFENVNEITAGMEEPCIIGVKADDLYQVVGGVLRAGDRIHIYSVSEENETTLVWDNVYVQGVFDQAGNQIVSGDTLTAAQRINVYLDKEDVPYFYSELARGSLRVVKAAK